MSRDPGFYKTPVVKSLLVLTSASSFLHSLAIVRNSYPAVYLVRVWSLPSIGVWLAAALILYQCRALERRKGSASFASRLVLSGAVSLALFSLLLGTSDSTGLPLQLIPGALVYVLVGVLALEYATTVTPRHSRFSGLPLSSNTPLYVLATLFASASINSAALAASGVLGGLIVRVLGVPLPHVPSWLTTPIGKMFASDAPPRLFSGANLSVQAQQRTDELELLMASMYNRQQQARRVVIGPPVRQQLPAPPEQQIQQLSSLGFSRQECVQALQHTGNNIGAAIQLLTAQRT